MIPARPINLEAITAEYSVAVRAMELQWAIFRINRENPRLELRYVRSLRRCGRIRQTLENLTKTGKL
jgi:hypothetical protein